MEFMDRKQGWKINIINYSFFCLLILPLVVMGCSGDEDLIPVISGSNDSLGSDPNKVYYSDIKLLLDAYCATAGCHSGDNPGDGLGMETYEEILIGSSRGPVVVSGDAQASQLYKTMDGTSPPYMPVGISIDQAKKDSIGKWIDDGLLNQR